MYKANDSLSLLILEVHPNLGKLKSGTKYGKTQETKKEIKYGKTQELKGDYCRCKFFLFWKIPNIYKIREDSVLKLYVPITQFKQLSTCYSCFKYTSNGFTTGMAHSNRCVSIYI